MAFVATKGGKKRVRAILAIKSSGAKRPARKKELARFKNEVRKLAKRYRGSVRSLTK